VAVATTYPALQAAQAVAGSTTAPTTLAAQLGNNMPSPFHIIPGFDHHVSHTASPFSVQAGNYATNAGSGLNFVYSSLITPSLVYDDANANGTGFGFGVARAGGRTGVSRYWNVEYFCQRCQFSYGFRGCAWKVPSQWRQAIWVNHRKHQLIRFRRCLELKKISSACSVLRIVIWFGLHVQQHPSVNLA
jgi:hypothetical protein